MGTSDSTPMVLAVFGLAFAALGAINQLIRHPPVSVDLTLRNGNGEFVVLGLTLAIAGVVLRQLKHRRAGA
jgi:hypothetical protein